MDTALEQKIYNNYRAMMKTRNKTSPKTGYPAYYRQMARQVTVERFNVSFKEVKRIVAKYDEINGITHEKNESAVNPFNKPWDHVPTMAYNDRFSNGRLITI